MTADEIAAFFTATDGSYRFARWGRPLAPVVFGVEDATLATVKGAIEAVATLAGHELAETDPELGANLMINFLRDWDELSGVPNLDKLIDGLGPLVARLKAAKAVQYRTFRSDGDGAIMAAFVFLRVDAATAELPAEVVALSLAVQAMLTWADGVFERHSALVAGPSGAVMMRPEIAGLIRAAYDPAMPSASGDATHALRLAARMAAGPR